MVYLPSQSAPWSRARGERLLTLLKGARPMGTKDCSGSNPGVSVPLTPHAQWLCWRHPDVQTGDLDHVARLTVGERCG